MNFIKTRLVHGFATDNSEIKRYFSVKLDNWIVILSGTNAQNTQIF